MHSILTMAVKDLKLISRDWLGLFFIAAFPVLMGIFFGSVMGTFDVESASLSIAVVDEDESKMSEKFIAGLETTGNVRIQMLPREEATDRVRRGNLVGMIVIPKGFGETAGILWEEGPTIRVGVDPSRQAEAGMLRGIILQSAGELMFARFQDPAAMQPFIEEARTQINANNGMPAPMRQTLREMMQSLDGFLASWQELQEMENGTPAGDARNMPQMQLARIETIDVTRELPKDSPEALVRQLRSRWDISFPQSMMWGVLACAAAFAISIVRERRQGTLLRLQVAPVTRSQILAGKGTACFAAVVGVVVMMVALGVALGMRPRSAGLLVLAALSIAFCFVCIMMLMSVIGKSEEAVSGAAWGANVVMAMVGGGMIPLAFMPGFMKTLSSASPVMWSILAMEGAIWRGFTLSEMLLPCGILLAVGAVCLTAGAIVLSRATS